MEPACYCFIGSDPPKRLSFMGRRYILASVEKRTMDFFRYYKVFLGHWAVELWSFGKEQVVGIILAVLIFLFQVQKGLIPEKDAALTAKVTILWPYLALIVIYLVIHLVRTPWKLDQKKQKMLRIWKRNATNLSSI